MAAEDAPAPTLVLEETSIPPMTALDGPLEAISLELAPGQLALVRLEREAQHIPLAEAAQGLVRPARGRVLFLGRDWRALEPAAAAACRARIGRVFEERGWVSNLDVAENITLAQRHHTQRPVAEILAEAEALARRFGLAGLPPGRPANAPRQVLVRAGWVRAFLGEPALLLLEQPTRQIDAGGTSALIGAVREARQRGAAVLWTTLEERILSDPSLEPALRMRMEKTRLLVDEGGP